MTHYAPTSDGLLAPLLPWLNDDSISEILINQPGEVYVEQHGHCQRHEVPPYNERTLRRLCQLIANENQQTISEKQPLLSGSLRDGSRVQLVLPPTAKHVTLSIRRQVVRDFTLADYAAQSFYANAEPFFLKTRGKATLSAEDKHLLHLYDNGSWDAFIQRAIELKKNIVVSGGTSSGKTTFLNACLRHIPLDERIITLEDTREIIPPHPNQVQLLASKGDQGLAKVNMQALVQCCLRLRPDRIIMGEIRGKEILDFVSACSTGHEGSITSIHANNPQIAFMRMTQLYKQNNVPSMTDADILNELHAVIDIVIQVAKTPNGRQVQGVYYRPAELTNTS